MVPPECFVVLGTFFAFCLGVLSVVESENWKSIDPMDPRKTFATEVWLGVKPRAPRIAKNGSGAEGSHHLVSKNRKTQRGMTTNRHKFRQFVCNQLQIKGLGHISACK